MTQKVEIDILKQIPLSWFTHSETSSIWLSGYRMMRISNEDIPEGVKLFDLNGARIFLLYGTFEYIESSSATPKIDNSGQFIFTTENLNKEAPIGAYLIIILPFDIDGKQGNEREIKERLSDIVGLLVSVNRMNMVYEHVFDYVYNLSRKEKSVIGNVIINPNSFPIPILEKKQLEIIINIDNSIESKEEPVKTRIRLALRWFKSAIYDVSGDAFIKYWIAIETLGMPDTTNIRPVNESLARIYNITLDESVKKFNIGRIFGLRGMIIHNGQQLQISSTILDYLESIFVDLLFEEVGYRSEHRVGNFIDENGEELSEKLLRISN
jgi:hypothetical protein